MIRDSEPEPSGLRALLRRVRRLKRRTAREREGLFLLEGTHLVTEAWRTAWPLRGVLYTADWVAGPEGGLLARLPGPAYAVSDELLAEIATTETPQGILAVAAWPDWRLEDLLARPGVVLVLYGLQDPGNLGTIVRAAEAAGAAGLLLAKGTVDPYNPKAVRAAMGSTFRLPVLAVDDAAEALRSRGYRILGTAADRGSLHVDTDLTGKVALGLGNEGRGLTGKELNFDGWVRLPMAQPVESLNAAAAATILLYEAWRQRSVVGAVVSLSPTGGDAIIGSNREGT